MSNKAGPGSLGFSASHKLGLAHVGILQSRAGGGAMGVTHSLLPQMSCEELDLR